MKKFLLILLASLIGSPLYSQQALADLADQCLLDVQEYTKQMDNSDSNKLLVHIQADKAIANYPEHTLFEGNVNIKQGNSILTADKVQLTQRQVQNQEPLRTLIATGNINYATDKIKLQGLKAWSNLNNKDIDVYQGNYQMLGRQGRGDAYIMKQRGNNRYTILKSGSFTSCLPGDDSWRMVGSEILHDREEQIVKIWNARFKIGKVPIFYSPYLQMQVGNKHRSGFLMPDVKYSSNNGLEFSMPYYLHLTSNYNLTITPSHMSKRGNQIQTKFRYLTTPDEGLVEFDWLSKNRIDSSKNTNDSDRWLFYLYYNGVIHQIWRFNVDYTKVSNYNYFDDLDTKHSSITDGYATQKINFGYTDKNWNSALSYKQFQVFDTNSRDVYCASPQLNLTYYKNDIGPFNLKIFSQAVKFTNFNNNYPKSIRLHIEPTLNLPITDYWGNMNIEAKIIATHFQQKNIDYYNEHTIPGRYLKRSVSRVLPQFKTNVKTVFERNVDYASDYTQTLEPHLQYLYLPYRNQNNIGVYDSTILQIDYSGLFRDRAYSGLDRIFSANQLTSGVTTRIYDDQRIELFNASVGQIYHFSKPCRGDITGSWDSYNNTGSVIWVGDSYQRISNQWRIHGSLQYDFRLNSVALGGAILEYRRDENHILRLNYRYASQKYIAQILSDINHLSYQNSISQVGVTGSWPLVSRWSLVGAYYYDTYTKQTSDQLVGLQYNTCCLAIHVGYERKITSSNNTDNSNQYDNKVSFNIELRGLNSNYILGKNKMMKPRILPYQQVF